MKGKKDLKQQALRPEAIFAKIPPMVESLEEETLDGVTVEERQLSELSKSAGWKIYKSHIKSLVDGLEETNSQVISAGASFDVIGQNAVVIKAVKELLQNGFDQINDATEAVTKYDESKAGIESE